MSRTLKTRPLFVRLADEKDKGVGYIEVHNHKNRGCDLPQDLIPKNTFYNSKVRVEDIPCHYTWLFTGTNLCACNMCTGHEEHKRENRKNRHEDKIKARNAIKVNIFEGEEF